MSYAGLKMRRGISAFVSLRLYGLRTELGSDIGIDLQILFRLRMTDVEMPWRLIPGKMTWPVEMFIGLTEGE
jgi:hypothetical protein